MANTKIINQYDTGNEVELLFSYAVNPDDLTLPVDTVTHMTWLNIDTGYKAIDNKVVAITSVTGGVINITYTPVDPETDTPGRYRGYLVFTVDEGPLTMPTVGYVNILILEQGK